MPSMDRSKYIVLFKLNNQLGGIKKINRNEIHAISNFDNRYEKLDLFNVLLLKNANILFKRT